MHLEHTLKYSDIRNSRQIIQRERGNGTKEESKTIKKGLKEEKEVDGPAMVGSMWPWGFAAFTYPQMFAVNNNDLNASELVDHTYKTLGYYYQYHLICYHYSNISELVSNNLCTMG